MTLTYEIENEQVPLEINKSHRKTMALYIHPEKIEVRAPHHINKQEIYDWLNTKKNWITKKWQTLKQTTPPPDKLHYLGQPIDYQHIPSKIRLSQYEPPVLNLYSPNKKTTNKMITDWYQKKAETTFAERLKINYQKMQHLNIEYPPLKIRQMKRRWGSCSHKGTVTLNKQLITNSLDCIDYVIIHELCHLIEFNHSKAFYTIMDNIMPNWKEIKNQLYFYKITP